MKKFTKIPGIIALAAVIGFSLAACHDDSGNNNGGGGNSDITGEWVGHIKGLYTIARQ